MPPGEGLCDATNGSLSSELFDRGWKSAGCEKVMKLQDERIRMQIRQRKTRLNFLKNGKHYPGCAVSEQSRKIIKTGYQ